RAATTTPSPIFTFLSPLFATVTKTSAVPSRFSQLGTRPSISLPRVPEIGPDTPLRRSLPLTDDCFLTTDDSQTPPATAPQNRRPNPANHGKIDTMPVRLIALDIDGTLLDSRWQLSDANRAAVAEAARRGIEVALVTGRRYDFAMPVAQQFDCPLTMIVNNGALIRTADGETHLRHLLTQDVVRSVLEATKPWREGAAVIFDRPRENQLMLESLNPDDSIRYAYYKRNLEHIGVVSPLENSVTEDPIQVMFSGTVAEMRAIEAILR